VAPWAYSGVAYPYTVLMLGSAALGGLCWLLAERRVAPLTAGLLFGLVAGFRQDLLLFLGPLFLVSLGWHSARRLLLAGIGLGLGGLAWLIPTVLASGGLDGFLAVLLRQVALVEQDSSVGAGGLEHLWWNTSHLLLFLVWQTLRWASVPILIYAASLLPGLRFWRDARARHLLIWLLPATLFYALVHIGDVGYVFSLAPPLFIAAGAGAMTLARWVAAVPAWRDRRWRLPFAVLTPAWLAWTLVTAGPALANDHHVFHTGRQYSALWMHCRDAMLAQSVLVVRERFAPGETLIVGAGFYQHARHYLPEYPAWLAEPGPDGVFRRAVPPETRWVVAYGYRMATRGGPSEGRLAVGCDTTLSVFRVEPGRVVAYRPDELWIE
jgi:hypothetical protein